MVPNPVNYGKREKSHLAGFEFGSTSLSIELPSAAAAEQDVDEMYREAPIKGGLFDYVEFTRILKHGAKEKDEQ